MLQKFILRSRYALGDAVLLTAAVRELHRFCPGVYQTDVATAFPDIWRHNPYLTPLHPYEPGVAIVDCEMPAVRESDTSGQHALHGFLRFFNDYFGLDLKLTELRGDIHLSRSERATPSLVSRLAGNGIPFWLISAGGRFDISIKWWDPRRYQEVVDFFQGRILFVQVGNLKDHHPRLEGVVDLRGQTTVRDVVRLMYHAQGVLCGVTGLMHLAAAVPVRRGSFPNRPCVVVAGGREPPSWEAYPGHQFLHTVGTLGCCASSGCWRKLVRRLEDRSESRDGVCVDARGDLPHCMDLISSRHVIDRIETYVGSGAARFLTRAEARAARRAVEVTRPNSWFTTRLSIHNAPQAAAKFIEQMPSYPGGFRGRGIVMCVGGVLLFASAWVCIQRLRALGCKLPVQWWHIGPDELDESMRRLVGPLGVECVDAAALCERYPIRQLHGWSLKALALVRCPWREVLLLDADNVPVRDPEYLFETREFRRAGAVFWPDYGRLRPERMAWEAFDVPYRDEPEFESGQVLVDKKRCWQALRLALWYNENSDCFYQFVHGDKETFHMAFRRLGQPYAMPARPIHSLSGVMCQHDFQGERIFQHRNRHKWHLCRPNKRVRGFLQEKECLAHLENLRGLWDCRLSFAFPNLSRKRSRTDDLSKPLSLTATMISCPARKEMRERTLQSLRESDWGGRPLNLVLDEGRFSTPRDRLVHTCWLALQAGVQTGADYILYLEDDVELNRHIFQNLNAWVWLRRQIGFTTLYNAGLPEVAWDLEGHAVLLDPARFMGSQALLMSRDFAQYCVEHWQEGPHNTDLKFGLFAGRWHRAIPAHSPSLAQHTGMQSVLGNGYHYSPCFDRDWRPQSGP